MGAHEERFFFTSREDWFIQEAALNLLVARLVRDHLQAAGATVLMTRIDFQPVTKKRPEDFRDEAEKEIGVDPRWTNLPELFQQAAREDAVQKRQERLFYRTSEIQARAKKVNEELKPDVSVAIHFNALETGDRWELTEESGLAVFVHGNYTPGELTDDEQKFFLFRKLLEGSHDVEVADAQVFVEELRKVTDLPEAYHAAGGVMQPIGSNDYVYARNLAANRQFIGPVIYCESYFMNNRVVYQRIQAGDYEDTREIDGSCTAASFANMPTASWRR